ncbi:MAG: hypothetical protein ABSE73_08975 [Planctomycetota bacterium]
MQPDPLIDDVRKVRHEISAKYGHDPRRLIQHYLDLQRELERTGKGHFIYAKREPEPAKKP